MSCAATASPNNTGDVMSRPDDGSKDETIAEVFNNEGESEYRKGEFNYAIVCYTEGISVNCNDKNLNAELFTNRAKAHFNLGNYHEAKADSEVARQFQPGYMKAIETGKGGFDTVD
ncbi:tetratricopeptide repeat protein 4-like isoform X1 [Orbicella faveolata]|uniref:tetratricopeptide repeat protein 4-like isoform X1 n=1 Tax=Orbicella faveolata TaxID=48498 RepID=UPI0009E266CC|nr:tetratricopeptide repeat protein 4-like isoform X1 [Orbicella faveolata]